MAESIEGSVIAVENQSAAENQLTAVGSNEIEVVKDLVSCSSEPVAEANVEDDVKDADGIEKDSTAKPESTVEESLSAGAKQDKIPVEEPMTSSDDVAATDSSVCEIAATATSSEEVEMLTSAEEYETRSSSEVADVPAAESALELEPEEKLEESSASHCVDIADTSSQPSGKKRKPDDDDDSSEDAKKLKTDHASDVDKEAGEVLAPVDILTKTDSTSDLTEPPVAAATVSDNMQEEDKSAAVEPCNTAESNLPLAESCDTAESNLLLAKPCDTAEAGPASAVPCDDGAADLPSENTEAAENDSSENKENVSDITNVTTAEAETTAKAAELMDEDLIREVPVVKTLEEADQGQDTEAVVVSA